MKILFVDDQKEVLRRLKEGINWEVLPVKKVYTACSAKDARLILNNFAIDVLISDIEMPEEDGLSLCSWAKEKFPDLEIVFLTSHADFEYAKRAFDIGSFNYILQPVREAEVEQVLLRLHEKLEKERDYRRIKSRQMRVLGQKNTLFDALLKAMEQGETDKAEENYRLMQDVLALEFENCALYPVLFQIIFRTNGAEAVSDKYIRVNICSILDDLLEEKKGKAGIAGIEENRYWIFIALDKNTENPDFLKNLLIQFHSFIEQNMDMAAAVYPCLKECGFAEAYRLLNTRMQANTEKKKGVFFEDPEPDDEEKSKDTALLAIAYIRKNLRRNITRTEVADHVHLNEEYFSRLFKKETGVGFKEFVLETKMEEAKKYLTQSVLSVEVIASKLGYKNLSHFSTSFKKMTDQTPQEYRKNHMG